MHRRKGENISGPSVGFSADKCILKIYLGRRQGSTLYFVHVNMSQMFKP